jgi:phosphoribosylformylglycinamidine (FGAM) synthase PurS component
VFDPQGQTIADALLPVTLASRTCGRESISSLIWQRPRPPSALAAEVADKVLANPVIESYRIEVD